MRPLVSVIVPCRNEAAFLERSIGSILASEYHGQIEVVVADGMSVDGSRQILAAMAARDPRLRVIDNADRITPCALNRAIESSRGEFVVRFDGHAVMPRDYVARCVELLESSGADNAGGSIRTIAQTGGIFSEPIALALRSRFGVGNSVFRTAGGQPGARSVDTVFGGCWRREIFSRIGGFNELLERGQDLEFNLRLRLAGGAIVLDPAIVCDYYARSGLARFWRHNFSNGVWAVLPFSLSEIVPVRTRHLIPLAFVVMLAAGAGLPLPWSIAVPGAYMCACAIASIRVAWTERRFAYLVLMPVVFASLHLAYGLGSAWGCLKLMAGKFFERKGMHGSRIET